MILSGKLKLDETKAKIIDRRIDCFAEKTNPDKLKAHRGPRIRSPVGRRCGTGQ
jgi:hypothetical protein